MKTLLVIAVLGLLARDALAACKKDLYFKDGALCSANRNAVIELTRDPTFPGGVPQLQVGDCSRALRCPVYSCAITISAPDERSCVELERILGERKILTERYVPLCSLSIDGKPFGTYYEQIDRSRHFKFKITVSQGGSQTARQFDLALTGKGSVQKVALPPGTKRCGPVKGWNCISFGDTFDCSQRAFDQIRFGNTRSNIVFAREGNLGTCIDLAKNFNQMQTLPALAACLVPPPQVTEPAPQQAAAEEVTEEQLNCAALEAHTMTGPGKSYILCLSEKGFEATNECCKRVRDYYREQTRRDNERIQRLKETIRSVIPGAGPSDGSAAAPH